MRKKRLSVVLLLILVVVLTSVLVACNNNTANPDAPVDPITPEKPVETEGVTILGSQTAWKELKNAAMAATAQGKDSRYVYLDTAVVLGYAKDAAESLFVLRVATSVDLRADDVKDESEILVELRQLSSADTKGKNISGDEALALVKQEKGKLLVGMYYYEDKLVTDLRGIKKGTEGAAVHAVYTNNIDMENFAAKLSGVVNKLDISGLIFKQLFGYDIGSLLNGLIGMDITSISVEDLIVNILLAGSDSKKIDNGNGSSTLVIPCDLSIVATILPLLESLVAENDIINLINDVLGLDINKVLASLAGMALYIEADIQNDILQSVTTDIDVNFNLQNTENATSKFDNFASEIGIKIGYATEEIVGTPDLDVVGTLQNRKYSEATDEMSFYEYIDTVAQEYSILTFEGSLALKIDTHKQTVTINDVLGSFGTLFTNIFENNLDKKLYNSLSKLFGKDFSFDDTNNQILLSIRANINTKNAEETRIAVELRGSDDSTRLGIYYDGKTQALYADAGGMFGDDNTKIKMDGINLNTMLDGLMDQLCDTIITAINGNAQAAAEYEKLLTSGAIVKTQSGLAVADGEIADTMGLVMAILDNIDFKMNGDIFNITSIRFAMTQSIMDYIFGLIFTPGGDLEGAKIPLTNASLAYDNLGFAKQKTLTINAGLGQSVDNKLVDLTIAGGITFGAIGDPDSFNSIFTNIAANANDYLSVYADGTLDMNILHIKAQTGINLNIETMRGQLAQLKLNLDDMEIGDTFKGMMIDVLLELGSIRTQLVLEVDADIDLTSAVAGGITVKSLLQSTAMIRITEGVGGNELLAIYLQDGYLYINANLACVKLDKIAVNIEELLAMFGVEISDGTENGDAIVAADGASDGLDMNNIIVLLAGVIDGFSAAKNSIAVSFASNIIEQLIDAIGIEGLEINIGSAKVVGGVSIELPDGLNLSEFRLGLYFGIGDNVSFDIGLKGIQLGVGLENTRYLDNRPDYNADDFVEILKYPYVSLDATLGLMLDIVEGQTTIDFGVAGTHWLSPNGTYIAIEEQAAPADYNGLYYYYDEELGEYFEAYSSTASVGFEKEGIFHYSLRVGGRIDLTSIINYLLGSQNINTMNSRSEFLVELRGSKFEKEEVVLLGLYYTGKAFYLDASHFGFNKIEVRADIFDIILKVLTKDSTIVINMNNPSIDALPSSDGSELDAEAKKALALSLIATLNSDALQIKLVQGLVDVLFELTGIDLTNVEAWLDVAWANLAERDGKQFSFGVNVTDGNNEPTVSGELYAKDIQITAGGQMLNSITVGDRKLSEYLKDSSNGVYDTVELFNEYGDLVVPSIYAELKGTISAGANAGSEDWNVGRWISAFMNGGNEKLESFLNSLLLSYSTRQDVGANIGFRIALKLRLNPEAPIDLIDNAIFTEINKYGADGRLNPDLTKYTEIYKLEGSKYIQLKTTAEMRAYNGQLYRKEYIANGIALVAVDPASITDGEVYARVGYNYAKVNLTANNRGDFSELYVPASVFSIDYILSHSDIAIELYTDAIEAVDNMTAEERTKATLATVRFVYNEGSESRLGFAAGTLYVDLIDDFHIALSNLNVAEMLGDVLAVNSAGGSAVTSAEQSGDVLGSLVGNINNFLSKITVDDEYVTVNFAEALIVTVVNMIAGTKIDADKFVKLNSSDSFLTLDWYTYALALQLQIDPVKFGITLSELNIGVGSDKYSVLPENFDDSIYTGVENLDNISLNLEFELDVRLKEQEQEILIQDYLELLGANIGLELGIMFNDEIEYRPVLKLGANISLSDVNSTEIVIELAEKTSDSNILALYLKGQTLYVDFGSLGKEAFYIENTNISALIAEAISSLLGRIENLGGSEALMAAESAASLEEQLQILMSISDGKLGLVITQNVILGLISALVGGTTDVGEVIDAFDLDLSISAELTLSPTLGIDINVDSKLLAVGLSIRNVDVETGANNGLSINDPSNTYANVSKTVDEAINRRDYVKIEDSTEDHNTSYVLVTDENGTRYVPYDETLHEGQQQYVRENHFKQREDIDVVGIDLNILVDYETSATYMLIEDQRRLETYDAKDRYSLNASDGRFVQDPNGTYVKDGFPFDDSLEAILDIESLQDVLDYILPIIRISTNGGSFNIDTTNESISLGTLLKRLGLNLLLDDALNDGVLIGIKLRVNTKTLGIDVNNFDFNNVKFDLDTILKALEASITLDFTYEQGEASTTKVIFYLIDGKIYIDASGISAPKISADLMQLLNTLGISESEALLAEGESGDGKAGLMDYLNAVVKGVVVTGTPWYEGSLLNKLDFLGLYFKNDMLNSLISMLFDDFDATSDLTILDDESGLFLRPSDTRFTDFSMISLELLAALANKKDPSGTKSFLFDLVFGFNLNINIESENEFDGLLKPEETYDFIDLNLYIENILAIYNGFYEDSYNRVQTDELLENGLYYLFDEDEAGDYIQIKGVFRLINEGEELAEGMKRYSRTRVRIEDSADLLSPDSHSRS